MVNNMHKNLQIQGLRALAFLLIFWSHTNFIFNSAGVSIFGIAGAFGVQIFIIMSGYLSFKYKKADKEVNLFSNVINKMKKFYLLHIVMFIVSIPSCIEIFSLGKKALLIAFLNITLLQSWIPDTSVYFSFNAVSWYLSTYVFLIICTPYIVKIFKRISLKLAAITMSLIVIFEFLLVLFSGKIPVNTHWLVYIFPPIRCLDIALGCGLARMLENSKDNKWLSLLYTIFGWITGIALLVYNNINYSSNEVWLTAMWCIPSIFIIAGIGKGRAFEKFYSNKILLFIGNLSLQLFLMHQMIIRYSVYIFNHKMVIEVYLFALGITVISAYVYKNWFTVKIKRLFHNVSKIY